MLNKFLPKFVDKGFNPEKPIIFLDMDGTCNSTNYSTKANSAGIFEKWQIDPDNIKCLNKLSDWNFVLSSSWRRFMDLDKIQKKLIRKGFEGRLLDITPIFTHPAMVRGNEIKAWLDSALISPVGASYVILDDETDMLYDQTRHFIHIDPQYGIQPGHIQHILNNHS